MKILFLTVGPNITASSRARVYQYLPYLHKAGIETHVIFYTSKANAYKIVNAKKRAVSNKIFGKSFTLLSILRFLFHAKGFDILFIQKVLLPKSVIAILKMLNTNIIFDFDDAIFLSEKYNYKSNDKFIKRFNYILENSKCVIASNNFLKQRVLNFNKNIFVINTPIDLFKFSPNKENRKTKENDNIIVGWIGSPASSEYLRDLEDIFKILTKRHNNIIFEFIGADDFYKEFENFRIKEWNFDSEVNDLKNFDIGIMPLRDEEWCQGKGGYKLLQYMAAGIPCVASPVGINKEIIKNGTNGFLANTPNDWLNILSLLISDTSLRQKMGQEGLRLAEKLYSYKVNAFRLIDALNSINSQT